MKHEPMSPLAARIFDDCAKSLSSQRETEGDEVHLWLAASVAIMKCLDVGQLRSVIHLAEGRIMEIENGNETR